MVEEKPKISYDEALSVSGWLHKKSSSVFGGYQKRFFSISSENKLIFSDSKGGKAKGVLDLDFAKLSSETENAFKLVIGDKEFLFKAENADEKVKWLNALTAVISFQKKPNTFTTTESNVNNSNLPSKRTFEGAQIDSTDHELSRKCLEIKGLNRLLDKYPKDLLESRIIYGFLLKRHKSTVEVFQKRWYFLISPRPLSKATYDSDEAVLEESLLPGNFSFDTLYYYKVDSENDKSESVGKIELMDSQGIEIKDKEGKLYILIEVNGRKYELVAENTVERKKWVDALKCSSNTASDYKNSTTKKPRNVNKLVKIFEKEGEGKLKEIVDSEKKKIAIDDEIKINLLEDLIRICGKIEKHLFETLDGCLLNFPPAVDVIKVYVEGFNQQILDEVKDYWTRYHKQLHNNEIIELSCLLYNYEERLSDFGVTDPNFSLNGRELLKIFSKKFFLDVKSHLHDIMRQEREEILLRNENRVNSVPEMIFKFLNETYETTIKNTRIKQLFEFFVLAVKETILNYVLMSDHIVNSYNHSVSIDYLISISNNSGKISQFIDEFIINITKENVLQDNEVNEYLRKNHLSSSINIMSTNAVTRVVTELYTTIGHVFMSQPFIGVSLPNTIFVLIKENFEKVEKMFQNLSKKTFWTEIFHATLFYYMCSLFRSGLVNVREPDEIKYKITTDKDRLMAFFETYFEKFILTDHLKVFDDIFEALAVRKDSLSNCCFKLRKLHGSNFTVLIAKAFVSLRMDFTQKEKEIVVREVTMLYEKNPVLDSNVQRNNAKLLLQVNEQLLKKSQKNLEQNNSGFRRKSKTLAEHLKEQENAKKDENEENELNFVSYTTVRTEKPNVEKEILSGYMKKKSYTVWQEKYFVIKNSSIYWYKSAESSEHQNFLSLTDVQKIQGYKTNKFMLIIDDKIYKFDCGNEERKNQWINVINAEMKKLKGKTERRVENVYQVKLRKKFITDLFKLPNVATDFNEILEKFNAIVKIETEFFREKNKKATEKGGKEKGTTLGMNLDFGLISDEQKTSGGIFSCCTKLIGFFKRKKNYDEFEENNQKYI